MGKVEITNMIMVEDKQNGKVVVLERKKYWCGNTFPGGHVEDGESIYESAVREAKEETGLDVSNLKACGVMHWFNRDTGDRYFCHFYRTSDFTGTLKAETDEGKVFWATLEELMRLPMPNNFREYLPIILGDSYTEGFCAWDEQSKKNWDYSKDNPAGIVYH